MSDRTRAAVPFLAIGIAFLALGATGRRAFFALGLVFLVLGILGAVRR
jgi:hypothetical protein